MSVNLQQAIQEQTQVLSEDEMRQVLNFMNRLRKKETKPQTLGELIDECFKDVPPEVMDKLPADASLNLDHYLYGAPKKMNNDLFVDTLYLVARLNPKDQWHKAALEIEPLIKGRHLVTTETVLIELLNYLAEFPPQMREAVAKFVKLVLDGFLVEVVFHTHDAFLQGLELYENRLDKSYSLTDCISMLVMRERGIQEALTHDHHFEQEGFTILL